jgi:hypothetical protein
MLSRCIKLDRLSRCGIWLAGLAMTLFSGHLAWAQGAAASSAPAREAPPEARTGQEPAAGEKDRGEATTGKPSRAEQRAAREWLEQQARSPGKGTQRHPVDEEMISEARAEVELLEAQVEAKHAHIRLVEARLKKAKAEQEQLKKSSSKGADDDAKKIALDGDVGILEAELETERAEVKEPMVLLKYARRRVEKLEELVEAPQSMHHMGWSEPMGHPGMMMGHHWAGHPWEEMHHMGMHPMDMHHMDSNSLSNIRLMEVDDKLLQLRDAIEELEMHMERMGPRDRQ